ncbi:MAG: radical SAM peptide maturase, CXXX-repeat target family [Spirochaetales bacterium]|nr:radical SAM peptide maturase, CXXX-repeat target family [Spirochaetales bacterium]
MAIDLDELGIRKRSYSWEEGHARTVTFVVTEDCQLRCRYCYVHGKNNLNKMDVSVAEKTVEYLINERELFNDKSIIFDFIGGEPFLEVELIDEISDYIKRRLFEKDHPWFNSYRFSFSTNGILYDDPRVQKYIEKNKSHISIGITIDGTKKKHDLQRIYPDGKGSYDDVVRNVPLWLEQFPGSGTKVTVASDDLPLIKESVLHLWSLGIKEVNINCVFENVWKEGDDKILEDQLTQLADVIIDNDFYVDHYCSFFSDFIGKPLDISNNTNWCGSGKKMLAVDCRGNFYPCNRFLPFTMSGKNIRSVGNCHDGVDLNKLRPFFALDRLSQSPEECITCEAASGCALCVGLNYDESDTDTIYQRATFICEMHKARCRANHYYWDKLLTKKGVKKGT